MTSIGVIQEGKRSSPRSHNGAPEVSPTCRLRGDGWIAQLTRFALVGGSSNVLYALAFLLVDPYGSFAANIVGVLLSTMLANELHRRLTFHAAQRVGWFPAQWEGGSLAFLGLLLSTLVLALLHVLLPSAGAVTKVLLVIAVSAITGGLRFLFLRGWVFAPAVAVEAVPAQRVDGGAG